MNPLARTPASTLRDAPRPLDGSAESLLPPARIGAQARRRVGALLRVHSGAARRWEVQPNERRRPASLSCRRREPVPDAA
jgi:hypothetical protein